MYKLGYDPYKTVTVREDLLFKYSKLWNLTKYIEYDENEYTIVDSIIMEDVGVKIDDVDNNYTKYCSDLGKSLKELINNKKIVKKRFAEKVKSNGRAEETGRNVGELLKRCLGNLIPSSLIGGQNNKKRFILTILKALMFGKKDEIPIKVFMYGIKLKPIQWFKCFNSPDIKVKTNVIAKLLLWLWRITKRLIASQFYVSEKQGCFNSLVYISKCVWQQNTDRAFKSLVSSGALLYLNPESAKKMESLRQKGRLRWLPKEVGLRPIVSVRNDKNKGDTMIAKSFLNTILKVMKTDFTIKHLHKEWKAVVTLCNTLVTHQLYFVSVDFKDAYGSIIQDKLVEIVNDKVSLYFGDTDSFQFDFCFNGRRKVVICRELNWHCNYRVLSSQQVPIKNILKTITNAIKCQTIIWGKKSYLMTKGISQAVSLSAALCKIYLAHLHSTHLSAFCSQGDDSDDTLVRAIDDILYITPIKEKAQKFLERMSVGFSDYGIFINPTKTQSNLMSHTEINYYGLLFNTENMEVYVIYAKSNNVSFRNMMTFNKWEEKQHERYSILRNKMLRIPSFKLNKLTTDSMYMTARGLARNVFETACFMACCFSVVVHRLYEQIDPEQLTGVANFSAAIVTRKVTKLMATSGSSGKVTASTKDCPVKGSCGNVTASSKDCPVKGILKSEIYWIVMRAFRMCLTINSKSDKKGFPECMLPYLEQQEEKSKMRTRLQFRKCVYDILDEVPVKYRNGH